MRGCEFVNVSPNKPNIFYSVEKKKRIGDIGKDLSFLVSDLLANNIKAIRTIVYCQSLDNFKDLTSIVHYGLVSWISPLLRRGLSTLDVVLLHTLEFQRLDLF